MQDAADHALALSGTSHCKTLRSSPHSPLTGKRESCAFNVIPDGVKHLICMHHTHHSNQCAKCHDQQVFGICLGLFEASNIDMP